MLLHWHCYLLIHLHEELRAGVRQHTSSPGICRTLIPDFITSNTILTSNVKHAQLSAFLSNNNHHLLAMSIDPSPLHWTDNNHHLLAMSIDPPLLHWTDNNHHLLAMSIDPPPLHWTDNNHHLLAMSIDPPPLHWTDFRQYKLSWIVLQ